MPILTKEQGDIQVGGSSGRFQSIDTYSSPPADRGAGDTADRLARSLGQFANIMAGVEQDQEAERKQIFDQEIDAYVADVTTDMNGGLSALAASKKILPQESPVTQNRVAQAAVKNKLADDLYPEWSKILADQATLSNPAALTSRIADITKQYLEKNPNLSTIERAALQSGLEAWGNTIKQAALEPQAAAQYDEMKRLFLAETSPSVFGSQNIVASSSKSVGIDPKFTLAIMKSYNPNGDPSAKNRFQGQTASGLMDITDGTWHYLVDKYGAQYGVTEDMKNDPRGSALMGAAYAKELYDQLTAQKGSPATVGEVNGAYMLGYGGFRKLLEAGPDAPINRVLDPQTFRVNANFFRRKDGSVMTAKEAMAKWEGAGVGSGALVPTRRFDGAQPFVMTKETFSSSAGYKWTDFKNSGAYGGEGQFDGRLINMLDAVTGQFGKGKLALTSGYRDPEYNTKVSFTGNKKGSESQHSHGTAIDIDVSKYSEEDKKRLVALFVANGARGVGHYSNGTIHIDLRAGKGQQEDGMALWWNENQPYQSGQAWFSQGVDEGRKMRAEGAVPASGFNGQDVNGFDLRVAEAEKYGLTKKEARDLLFGQLAAQAQATRDFSILDSIPDGSISLEQQTKKMEIAQAIPKLIASDVAARDTITESNRKKAYEAQESSITAAVRNGNIVDVDAVSAITYKDADGNDVTTSDPKLRALASALNEQDRVDSTSSAVYSGNLNDKLRSMFLSGDPGDLFETIPNLSNLIVANGGKVPDISDIRSAIYYDPNMTKADKAKLVEQLPDLAETFNMVRDPVFLTYANPVNETAKAFTSLNLGGAAELTLKVKPEIKTMIDALPSKVEDTMRNAYLAEVQAWQEDNPNKTFLGEAKKKAAENAQNKALKFYTEQKSMIQEALATAATGKKEGEGQVDQAPPPYKSGETVSGTYEGRPITGRVDSVAADAVMVEGTDGIIYAVPLNQIQSGSNARIGDNPTAQTVRTSSSSDYAGAVNVPQITDEAGSVVIDLNKADELATQLLDQAERQITAQQEANDRMVVEEPINREADRRKSLKWQNDYTATRDQLEVSDTEYQTLRRLVEQLYASNKDDQARKLSEALDQYIIDRMPE